MVRGRARADTEEAREAAARRAGEGESMGVVLQVRAGEVMEVEGMGKAAVVKVHFGPLHHWEVRPLRVRAT